MRKSISLFSASLLLMGLGVVPAANAFTISLVPQVTEVGVGETVSVDVVASGLVDGVAPALAGYDLSVSFDASLLSVLNVTFGTGLDVTGLGSGHGTIDLAPGLLEVFEFSFDPSAELNALQPDAFTLFTLTFNANSAGASLVGLALNGPQSSAEGTALTVDALNGASLSITPVPLPAAAWLLLSGLAGVGCFSRKGRRAA